MRLGKLRERGGKVERESCLVSGKRGNFPKIFLDSFAPISLVEVFSETEWDREKKFNRKKVLSHKKVSWISYNIFQFQSCQSRASRRGNDNQLGEEKQYTKSLVNWPFFFFGDTDNTKKKLNRRKKSIEIDFDFADDNRVWSDNKSSSEQKKKEEKS